jgi:hypothetical protein
MDEKQRAEITKSKADSFKVDVDAGVVPIEVLRQGRENQLIEDATYPGLDAALEDYKKSQEAPKPGDLGETVNPNGDVQAQAFNGAQIAAVKDIVAAVVANEMPPETAIQLIILGFPAVNEASVRSMIGAAATFEAPPKPTPTIVAPPPVNPNARPPLRVVAGDAEPRSLYVHRDVRNASELIKWAKDQGFETTQPAKDMHVTIAYSKRPIDWMKVGEDWGSGSDEEGNITIKPGGVRLVEAFGDHGEAVVLLFTSSDLTWRWRQIKEAGADWKYGEDYQPHITITLNKPVDLDLSKVEPYRGEIQLGPEIFEEVQSGAQERVVEE